MRIPALLLASVLPLSAPGGPTAPPALTGAAVQASESGQYCEALALFEASNARWPSARSLYNAAEVANAAGYTWRAIELYQEAQRRYPEYERRGVMQRRLAELGRRLVTEGPGTACPETAPTCGDWRVLPGETCDDGNTIDGDGCDGNCKDTGCGNGVITAGEDCDDGNGVNGDGCDANCTLTACGNGVVTPGEACDDGNAIDGDGCDHTCTPSTCGNGIRTGEEECDDGNSRDGDGCDDGCRVTRCGNGIRTQGETCDDGNAVAGDGCESTCTITRVAAPVPGLLLASAGVVGGAVAAGLFWAAGYVWMDHQQSVVAIEWAEDNYARDPEGAVDVLVKAREREEASRIAWEGWGRAAIGGGVLLGVGGLSALGGGIAWALTRTEELEPEDAP